ncbi:hypothetical protein DCAR_0312815 [Daucus carota subsp. sativus]|uniref:Uncharacterized protein n=1 Tax=Daucus carota subsp. sativus TaxID=79200 RepID=A0A166BAP0_DAUCS|nr:PREDICTED: uncharacterized protein LOC108215033 [Daucus carota subsp. sativus]WOG93529.1 hypothetical protein DCAR_0312815 [Daucus carota subsp. sativus]
MEFPPSDPPPSTFVPVTNYAPAGSYAPPANYAPVANYATAVYDSPPAAPSLNHPSYEEMVSSAILGLNDKGGSSRQAIAKYIENHFKIAPSQTHGYELTQQLKRMKNSGQLVLNKHSYMFPGSVNASVPAASVTSPGYNGMSQGQGQSQGPVTDVTKRRPGRPPKLQPNGGLMGSAAPPVSVGFENQQVGGAGFGVPTANLFGGLNSGEFQFAGGNVNNNVPVPLPVPVSNHVTAPVSNVVMAPVSNVVTAPVSNTPTMVYNGGAMYDAGAVANVVPIEQSDVVSVKRGRGRPRKVNTSAVGVESGAITVLAGEDSAAKNNVGNGPPAVTPPMESGKKRRGRPAKLDKKATVPVVNGGVKQGQDVQAMVLREGKRGRGRPRKNPLGAVAANGVGGGGVMPVAKKPRKVSGKPVGRPRKNAAQTASLMSEIQMLAYEGLKARVEHYQSRIRTAISVVKPYLNETAVIALGALQDLEELASMDIISVPPSVQGAVKDVQSAPVNVEGAPLDVQSAPMDVQSAPVNVLSAPVDLNAPVNVSGPAPENIQSAPLTAEGAPSAFQSAPTGETTESAYQSAPVPVSGQ